MCKIIFTSYTTYVHKIQHIQKRKTAGFDLAVSIDWNLVSTQLLSIANVLFSISLNKKCKLHPNIYTKFYINPKGNSIF